MLWTPPPDVRTTTRVGAYLGWLASERGHEFDSYADLWAWSVDDLDGFWTSIWDHFEVGPRPEGAALATPGMPGARWFPDTVLNYAGVVAAGPRGDGPAVVSVSQTRPRTVWTWDGLADAVGRARAGLVRLGVGRGDRVAAYLPNIGETIVAFLATASLGAVWSSCAPEFGVRSVVDRFNQIDPVVLLTVDGYRYGSTDIDRTGEVAAIRDAMASLRDTVVVPYLRTDPARVPGALPWDEFTAEAGPFAADPVPFDHPLYILFSSGTTGLPKAIVHGHGGIVLEHLKALALHADLRPDDVFFWFTTTGWMMWNFLVSGLLLGTTVVCFDGNPGAPDLSALWRVAADERISYFGASAPFLRACRKEGLRPRDQFDLSALLGVGSTGAPLPAEGFRWVYDAVADDVVLGSVSGGTDVCTAFVGMTPLLPVRAGEIACRYLGAAVEAFDPAGRSVVGEVGELVITEPMPSMPVGFWDDPDGTKYRAAYFDDFPGVWRHGDWITILDDGSCVITGRSDATLNRGGVRLGTAEFYAVVDAMPEIVDSLVVHLEDDDGGAGELLLFVVLDDGDVLDDGLRGRIAAELRRTLSPRHVPDAVIAVDSVPRTLSGKKLEIPVKRILQGTAVDDAASRGALANPESLLAFERLAAERAS